MARFYSIFIIIITMLLSSNTNALSMEKVHQQTSKATMHIKKIVLGAGCFWGVEKRFESIPGVIDAESGYADGHGFEANYKNITNQARRYDENNYAEVVQITYNSNIISTDALLQHFFENHDPTQKNKQGTDIGTQYRSIILTTTEQQAEVAIKVKNSYQQLLDNAGFEQIQTDIKPLTSFFPAEQYHQNYLQKNPNASCPQTTTGVKFKNSEENKVDNSSLLIGKQIVVIDSQSYCPYCEKFKKEVANSYKGTINMSFRHANQLQGLKIKSATWATPTILFLENGSEVYAHPGYMSSPDFYKALGKFKLGNTYAYKVAFNAKTDRPYCKEYKVFKDTPDGVFVDKLSGEPLFDTRDRFNSGTGWLSFTKPINNSVTEHDDSSWGMKRTELRSKSTGIHLGHVFEREGPKGQDRYCINATVLEFIPR
ncbi:peptide-methionine (S)-S-oxide reductase MsrA [Pseudoalteromonas sp. MMG010]|uniref:peptide-methionine (S)-S-oxide reductase MsrA n=1 Tax=Pseudoalteromonas sp. MMG010 TaxID=2822685 RepID=UPI001B3A465B|nr:peptide-methionine (S)-S-oxide reductase MsrA [Pseudoalteromonas sp. MMG010]MBQ4832387.1 peptide-methionine (S)-S-oxide reductase MsrA [Pseudoalteromonas sp. MMG010]